MAKPTCEIRFDFYVVQPVSLSPEAMTRFFASTSDQVRLQDHLSHQTPSWLSRLTDLGNTYQGLRSIRYERVPLDLMDIDLSSPMFRVFGKHDLSGVAKTEGVETCLLFDRNLKAFVLTYRLPMRFDKDSFLMYTAVHGDESGKQDLYNTVRNMFVREDGGSVVGEYVTMTEERVRDAVRDLLESVFSLKVGQQDVRIEDHSGNISNFVTIDHPDCPVATFADRIIELNEAAEFRTYQSETIILDDGTYYDFNGRFHTIVVRRKDDIDRFIPIQFHAQYMWSYLNAMYGLLDDINDRVMTCGHHASKIARLVDMMDDCIQKTQYLHLFHQGFLRAIESDNQNIYKKIESLWNLDASLEGTDTYVNNFKDLISRRHEKVLSAQQERQSKILFVISVIQIISLIGVWQTYIGLVSDDAYAASSRLVALFGSVENLMAFNTFLPVVFMLIALALWLFGFKRRSS